MITQSSDNNYKNLSKEQQEFVDDLKGALHEVELHQQGEIELPTFEDMINEL